MVILEKYSGYQFGYYNITSIVIANINETPLKTSLIIQLIKHYYFVFVWKENLASLEELLYI